MTSIWANQWEGQWTNVSSDAKIRPSDCERGGKIDKLGVPTPIRYLQKVVTSDDGDVVPTISVKFSKTEKATIQQYIKHESLEACVNTFAHSRVSMRSSNFLRTGNLGLSYGSKERLISIPSEKSLLKKEKIAMTLVMNQNHVMTMV